jgi:uncharacterized repeat protein (TIGR01451 family)
MSNFVADGQFFDQTHAPMLEVPAGESVTNNEFDATYTIKSTSADYQPHLRVSVSPDDGYGGRMSFVRFDDQPDGLHAFVVDNPVNAVQRETPVTGPAYSRTATHTVRFWIKFVPTLHPEPRPGELRDDFPADDIVRVFIDGVDIGDKEDVCFTTWEQWYRFGERREPPVTNSLTFMARTKYDYSTIPPTPLPNPPEAGGGYLFDDVSYTSADGAGPSRGRCGEPDIDIDKTTRTRSARPGDLITYRITVRNRGDAPARRLRACDRAPRALTFVRSTARLRRAAGGRLCLTTGLLRPGQRKRFRATFRLRANVTADTVTNGASADIATGSAESPVSPNAPGHKPRRRRVARDAATIGVRGETAACPAALHPRARAAC